MPAIARLDRERDRCSTSSGDRPSTTVLICTCTLVMSGTASIGSRARSNSAEAASDRGRRPRPSQRWRIEKRSTRSSSVPACGRRGVSAHGRRLLPELGLEQERVLGHDDACAAARVPTTISVVVPSLRPTMTGCTSNPAESARNTAGPVPSAHDRILGHRDRHRRRARPRRPPSRAAPAASGRRRLGSTTRAKVVRVSCRAAAPT